MTAAPPRSVTISPPAPRDDLRRRAITKLLEKCDPARARHKPLSLVRQEARRLAEQFLDTEAPTWSRSDREVFLDDLLADLPGLGPLDELFRDDAVSEFLILAHHQIIRRSGESWLPTSVQFRDPDHLRRGILKFAETGEPVGDAVKLSDGGFDVRLPNGFRMIAVMPPAVLELPPLVTFRRVAPSPSASVTTPAPRTIPGHASVTIPTAERSGTVSFNAPRPMPTGTSTQRMLDPWDRAKMRITERFVQRLAANGVYDLSVVASADLQRVIAAIVTESNDAEKLHMDTVAQERMTIEILAHMNRT